MKHLYMLIGLGLTEAGGSVFGDLVAYGNPMWPIMAGVATVVSYVLMCRRFDTPVLVLLVGAVFFVTVNISAVPFYFSQLI